MSLTIHGNKLASIANRAVTLASAAQERALQRLSTGQVAPSARYDAAGLAVSSRIRGEIAGLKTYVNNATQGVALLQTAEGAYQRVQDMLNRMRSLASQAQSSNLSQTERGMLDTEYQQIKLEITRLAKGTTFAGQALFETGNIGFQIASGSSTASTTFSPKAYIDVNGDGKDDLVYVNGNNNILAKFGNGDGTFSSTATTLITAINISDFVFTDMNGDGIKDFVLSRGGSADIWTGSGNGTYAVSTSIASGPDIRNNIVTGDFNGDGIQDFGYVESTINNRIVLQLSNSSGGYTAQYIGNSGSIFLKAADMDNNGTLDLVAIDYTAQTARLYANNGSATFSQTVNWNLGFQVSLNTGNAIALIDMDNDGYLDVVAGDDGAGVIHILDLLNQQDTQIDVNAQTGITSILDLRVYDFNGDGNLDIVTTDYNAGQLDVVSIGANLQISSVSTISTGTNPYLFFMSDINGDGKQDIGYWDDSDSRMYTLLNTSTVGMESITRVSSNAGAANNVAWRAAAITLNSLNIELGYSMITSKGAALRAEASIKNGLNNLLLNRTRVAAAVNRLEKVMDNVATMIENQEGARSAIADVDIAQEMSAFVANQVTLQAGISMLAQANQTPKLLIELFNRGGGA